MAIDSTTTSTKVQLSPGSSDGVMLGQSAADLVSFHGATAVAQRAGAAQAATGAAAPAGGTGAAAGGYDTAANRDLMIVLVNETRTLVNEIRATLVEKGLMKGAA